MLRVKFILEKTMQSFLDFDHRSYIAVLSDIIPFFNAHTGASLHQELLTTKADPQGVLGKLF